jgi:hypothetical protein
VIRSSRSPLFLLLAALSWPAPAHANDTAFRGAAANLFPQRNVPVRMLSEDILLVATGTEWRVVAKYLFESQSSQPLRLQVGFPELRCWSDPEYPCGHRHFRDLETTVGGQPVTRRPGKLSKSAAWSEYLGVIWLFDVEFAARARVEVEHRYRLGSSESSDGDRFTDYVIRTGSTWLGPIGHARFTVHLPAYALRVSASKVAGLAGAPPRIVDGPEPYVELVLEGSELRPEKDLQFRFNADPDRVSSASGTRGTALERGDADEIAERIRAVHAAKGYPFRSPDLHERYYSGSARFVVTADNEHVQTWQRDPRAFAEFRPDWFLREDLEELGPLAKKAAELGIVVDPEPVAKSVISGPVSTNPKPAPSARPPPAPAVAPRAHEGCRCGVPGARAARTGVTPAFGFLAALALLLRCRRTVRA